MMTTPQDTEAAAATATSPTGTEARVCADITRRQALGLAKYGTTVEANPLPLPAWLQHAYEETLDQAIYLRRAMEELALPQPQAVRAAAQAGQYASEREYQRAMGDWLGAVGELIEAMGRPAFKSDAPVSVIAEAIREAARLLAAHKAEAQAVRFDDMNPLLRRLHNAASVLDADGDEYGYVDLLREVIKALAAKQAEPVAGMSAIAKRRVFDAIREAYDLGYNDARNACAIPGDSAPGYKGREVEADHGGALAHALEALRPKAAQQAEREPLTDEQLAARNPYALSKNHASVWASGFRAGERARGIGKEENHG